MVRRQKLDRGRAGPNRLTSTQRVVRAVDQRGIGLPMLPTSGENCVDCAAGDGGSAYQKTWCGLFQSKERRGGPEREEICLYRGEGVSGQSWRSSSRSTRPASHRPIGAGARLHVRGCHLCHCPESTDLDTVIVQVEAQFAWV
jgi:hypothetical protein